MKNKQNKEKISNIMPFLWAVIAFVEIWMFAIVLGINWNSLDDPVISVLLNQDSKNISVYQQKWLLELCYKINNLAQKINVWAILNIFAVSCGIAATCYVIIKRKKSNLSFAFCELNIFAGYFFTLRKISYTCSAVLLFCGGIFLIIDAISEKYETSNKRWLIGYILGLFFSLLSFGIRKEAGFIGLGYLAISGLLMFKISGLHFSIIKLLTENKEKIILLGIAGILCICSVYSNKLVLTEEEKQYFDYNKACTEIRDYTSSYPLWEEARETYLSLGLTKNDYEMLFNQWVFDDPDIFNTEKLRDIGSLKYTTRNPDDLIRMPINALKDLIGKVYFAVLLVVGIIISVFAWKKQIKIIKIAAVWCFGAAYFLYIVYNGRIVDHVIFSILWGLNCCLILLICMNRVVSIDDIYSDNTDFELNPLEIPRHNSKIAETIRKMSYPSGMVLFVIAITTLIFLNGNTNTLFTPWMDYGSSENENRFFYDELNARTEDTFIFAPNLHKHYSLAYGPWSAFPKNYCENVFYLGGWQARTEYCVSNLKSRNIDNPMYALLEKDDVYSLLDENTEGILTFLREHYDDTASYSIVETINDNQLIRYCGSINDSGLACNEDIYENHTASYSMITGNPIIMIEGELRGDTDAITDVFCSVPVGENIYSFALNYNDGKYQGCLFVFDDGVSKPDLDSIEIIVKNSMGEMYIIE